MIKRLEGLSPILVPHKGYKEGYNVIMYNNHSNLFTDIIAALMNSGVIKENEAISIASVANMRGYFPISFTEKEKAEAVFNELKKIGCQVEIIHIVNKNKTGKPFESVRLNLKNEVLNNDKLFDRFMEKFKQEEIKEFFDIVEK